jgi:hypothetical protein
VLVVQNNEKCNMTILGKLLAIIIAAVFLSSCERELGMMLKEAKIELHGITITSRLYPISWYGAERRVVYWCQSTKTLSLKSEGKWDERGNLIVGQLSAGSMNHSDKVLKRLPNERVNIDLGETRYSVTFDGCASVLIMYANSLYDEPESIKTKPFKKNELSLLHEYDSEGLTPAFITGHTHQIIKTSERYCFNINQVWIKDPKNHYQVCTEDKGKNWYTTRKIGDGKVMKRLAGSEEWLAYE